jgi:putative transposase
MAEVVNDWLTLRDECLNVNEFETIERAREKNEAWRADYNERRPHGALGHLTPSEFAKGGQPRSTEATNF